MKVLVTGATSLLGRCVAQHLLARGDEVTTFQRSPSGLDCREVLGSVTDRDLVLRAASNHDGVIHLAALVAPRPTMEEAWAVNVDGTRHVLDAAAQCGRFVHISSPSVAFTGAPSVGEASPPVRYQGRDRYTTTKAAAEALVLADERTPTVVIRPHLVWGPGDTQLIGRLCDRARSGRLAIIGDGGALVDTTYVDDAAAAIVAGLDRAEIGTAAVGKAWTVTGNDPRPIGELIEQILAAMGITTRLRQVPAGVALALGSVLERVWIGDEPPLTRFAAEQLSRAHWFDQRAVHEALQWTPKVSVDEGLAALRRSLES